MFAQGECSYPGFRAPNFRERRGLTLVELLVAITLTLILVAAVLGVFQWVGDGVTKNRSLIEGNGQLRNVALRLQDDLDSITVPVMPWADPADQLGYFEYVEGPMRDGGNDAPNFRTGDSDDILMFTARAKGRPFVGRFGATTIESEEAEIIWWIRPVDFNNDGTPDSATVYRRVLLIRPDLNGSNGQLAGAGNNALTFYQNNDISVRAFGGGLAANSLGDLTKRECRALHVASAFPFSLDATALQTFPTASFVLQGARLGEDVMLSNVLAFDVRAYDPYAPVGSSGSGSTAVGVAPGDGQSANSMPPNTVGRGAYVDLNYSGGSTKTTLAEQGFQFAPMQKSGLAAATYCTWSLHYELGGVGLDGLDNGAGTTGIVAGVGERLAAPPCAVPLRGLRVRIRILEPSTEQIQQMSVVASFVPE